jgi:GxxExxY protein
MTRIDADPLLERELTGRIIGAFYDCYNELRFGFLESVYRRALAIELRSRGLRVAEEAPVEVTYMGVVVGSFRTDLLIENRVLVEAMATASLGPTDKRQLLNYLRATGLRVGLLLHFGPEPEFFRFVNEYGRQGASPSCGEDPLGSERSAQSAFASFNAARIVTPEPPSTSPS